MSRSFMPNGNIIPSRFVKQDTSTLGGYVLQAGASDTPIGVSQPGTHQPPIPGLDDGFAGIQNVGMPIEVFMSGDECWLEIGAAVTLGDFLKPSTNGVAITASADGDIYGAIALQSGTASGQLIKVRVTHPEFRGA